MRKIFRGYKMFQNLTDSLSRVLAEVKVRNSQKLNIMNSPEAAPMNSRPFTVVVEGNIGSGKTTFLQYFNQFSEDVEIFAEPVDKWRNASGHNLLQMMYEDPCRWSLVFQTYVQLTMVQNHTKVGSNTGIITYTLCKVITKRIKLMERSLFSAKYCFVENLQRSSKMPLSEYEVLSSWFEFLLSSPQVDLGVDLIVYMRTDPEVALSRLRSRGRGEEHLIAEEYIRDLHQLHEDWLVHGKHALPAPVIVVDANKDLEEMQEVFARQEKIIFGRARQVKKEENYRLNTVGSKRTASGWKRKTVLLEKAQH